MKTRERERERDDVDDVDEEEGCHLTDVSFEKVVKCLIVKEIDHVQLPLYD